MLHKDMKMCQFDLFRIIDGSKRPLGPGLIDFCGKKCLITEPYVERPLFEQSAPPPHFSLKCLDLPMQISIVITY